MIKIHQEPLSDEVKKFIFDGFAAHAISKIGYDDGMASAQTSFVVYDEEDLVGALSVLPFYGALWIKYFFIQEQYRGQGLGKKLMELALKFGEEKEHKFAFVETLSFQALGFYKNCGFVLEFTRDGYANDISFHYLKRDL